MFCVLKNRSRRDVSMSKDNEMVFGSSWVDAVALPQLCDLFARRRRRYA